MSLPGEFKYTGKYVLHCSSSDRDRLVDNAHLGQNCPLTLSLLIRFIRKFNYSILGTTCVFNNQYSQIFSLTLKGLHSLDITFWGIKYNFVLKLLTEDTPQLGSYWIRQSLVFPPGSIRSRDQCCVQLLKAA